MELTGFTKWEKDDSWAHNEEIPEMSRLTGRILKTLRNGGSWHIWKRKGSGGGGKIKILSSRYPDFWSAHLQPRKSKGLIL